MEKKQMIQKIFSILFILLLPIAVFAIDINTLKDDAAQGDAKSQAKLGWCYEKGEGVTQNYEEAVKWYRQAALQGYASGQCNLGWCYQEGKGVPQNHEEAVKWYRMAADQGHAVAQLNLGWCYRQGKGVPQNYEKAVKWYRKAADQGEAEAQCSLGWFYDTGRGVPQNYEEAVKWYRMAADQGHAVAQLNLGWCYENGAGVQENWNEAFKWFKKAAEQGDARAQYFLGWCYEKGGGVTQNWDEAARWYTKAANQGFEDARERLNEIQTLKFSDFNKNNLTWEQFYDKERKFKPTFRNEEELRNTIQAVVEEWQKKGEFETTDAWKKRVNDKTREEFIRKTTDEHVAIYNQDLATLKGEQEKIATEYEAYQEKNLKNFYELKISQSESKFSTSDFDLMPYDADNQTFLIHSGVYGDILLPVLVSEAPSFKENWNDIKSNIKPEFVPNGEDVALSKLVFKNNGKEYIYDSHTQANYTTIDIEYNFPPIGI